MRIVPNRLAIAVILLIAAVSSRVLCLGAEQVGDRAPHPPASQPSDPFAIVMIDAKTEKKLGPFPYDRSISARAIKRAADAGARGVVLKFFFDQPKNSEGDHALADAMLSTKVILQARIDESEANSNELPARFTLGPIDNGDHSTCGGNRGWLPLPALSARAYDVGFIDHVTIDHVPVIEQYNGKYVKSLYICCLELARGKPAHVLPGKSIQIGDATLPIDQHSEVAVTFPAKDDLRYISFIDLLDAPAMPALRDRVVIIGWDGDAFEPVQTPAGKIKPHRAFCYALRSLSQQLQAPSTRPSY